MSDDLVKRLRDHIAVYLDDRGHVFEDEALCDDAADRIEELEAKLATCEKYRAAYAERDRIGTQAVRELEAKLAKAVEALEAVYEITVEPAETDHRNVRGWIEVTTRTTLAELKC